ncbi:hypothetical protein ACJRO7_030531 [Eucalyptus globulus]|uniref:Endonuclease/exonuclease/phosphatase domain-containing protein n=1 Tax=Eucalyptus globulus TaxID=34317 RepID=A0ABD3JF80_EUCGL
MQLYSYERQSKYIQSDDSKLMEFKVLGFIKSFLIWLSDKIVCIAKFYASLSPITLFGFLYLLGLVICSLSPKASRIPSKLFLLYTGILVMTEYLFQMWDAQAGMFPGQNDFNLAKFLGFELFQSGFWGLELGLRGKSAGDICSIQCLPLIALCLYQQKKCLGIFRIQTGKASHLQRIFKGKAPVTARGSLENGSSGGDPRSGRQAYRSTRTVVEVLRELEADIVALQNVKAEEEREMKPLSELAAALGMSYAFAESWAPEYGNAVLSRWPIKHWKVQKIFDDTDFRNVLKATIEVPHVGEVNFQCTHLDHLDENWRMKQVGAIIQSSDSPHILAGGLNSLDETDYSQERWTDIVKYYEEMGKPTPKVEVMRFLKSSSTRMLRTLLENASPWLSLPKDKVCKGRANTERGWTTYWRHQIAHTSSFQDHIRSCHRKGHQITTS